MQKGKVRVFPLIKLELYLVKKLIFATNIG